MPATSFPATLANAAAIGRGPTRRGSVRLLIQARCVMTAVSSSSVASLTRSRTLTLALAASVLHMLMMVPGYSEDGSLQIGEWLVVLAISAAISLTLFLFVVPRAGVTAGIVLGALAVASVLVFWAGITLPLAAAAGAVGWQLRQRGNTTKGQAIVLGLAALAAVALVAIIVWDAVAN